MRKKEVAWRAEEYIQAIEDKVSYWSVDSTESEMYPGSLYRGGYFRMKGAEKGRLITLSECGYLEMLEKMLDEIEKEAIVNGR